MPLDASLPLFLPSPLLPPLPTPPFLPLILFPHISPTPGLPASLTPSSLPSCSQLQHLPPQCQHQSFIKAEAQQSVQFTSLNVLLPSKKKSVENAGC